MKKFNHDLTEHLAASSGCQVGLLQSEEVIRDSLSRRLAAKKALFQEGNKVKRLRYARADKTHSWTGMPSPDQNIIEVVWDHLNRERNMRQPKSKGWLKGWSNMKDYIKKNFQTQFKMC